MTTIVSLGRCRLRQLAVAAIVMGIVGGCGGGPSNGSSGPPATGPSRSGPAASSSSVATPTASVEAPLRIELGGRGPLGLAVDGTTGWVVETDSGQLTELDLLQASERRSIDIGTGGSGVVVGADGTIFVSRYDTGSSGEGVVVLRAPDRHPQGLSSGPLGGLALGEDGTIWTLEKGGRVVHLDPRTGRELGATPVTVDPNEHMDIAAGAGARWLSSDHTAIRRIAPDGTVAAEIETGGGIPLAFADGLVWGARADEVWAIDPSSNAVTKHVALEGVDEILAMEVDGGVAWIAVRRPARAGRVIAVDLASGRLLTEHAVALPAAVELSADRVWVTDYESDAVLGFRR